MNSQPLTLALEERLPDADITAAVEMLLLKKGVCSQLIRVDCRDGIVELLGFADNLLARERATDIAKAVRGVRGVINEIIIQTPDVPDPELQARVERALWQDPTAVDYNVHCYTQDGEVTLEGTVQTWAEEQLVLRVLHGVPGVRRITSRLNVRGGDTVNSDEEITTQIRELLEWDIRVKSPLVEVRTEDGVVHLSGTVGTAAEYDQVVTVAYLAGANRVDARNLMVAYWALDKALRRQKLAPKSDQDVARAIADSLRLDPRVQAFEPTVHVRDGVATLGGTVSNLRARQAAEQDAANVVGVWGVNNLLQVRGQYPSPDGAIHDQVKAALAADGYVGHYNFTVNVSNGKAQLYGTVDTHFDKERAADIAAGINGVVDLVSHIQLATARNEQNAAPASPAGCPSTLDSDYIMEQRIRNHFYWSALLHDQDIEVSVRDGRVTLNGTVETWLERKRAAAEAHDCGARDVNNHLHLMTTAG